jgi:hypothetical protein
MTMPDNSERKRLKKKMLDRWENEGGRITADPVIANESNPASQRKGKNSQGRASNDSSRDDSISSRKTRRRLTQK